MSDDSVNKTPDEKTEKNEELYTPHLPKKRRRFHVISSVKSLKRRRLFDNRRIPISDEIPSSSASMYASSSSQQFRVCYNYLFV